MMFRVGQKLVMTDIYSDGLEKSSNIEVKQIVSGVSSICMMKEHCRNRFTCDNKMIRIESNETTRGWLCPNRDLRESILDPNGGWGGKVVLKRKFKDRYTINKCEEI